MITFKKLLYLLTPSEVKSAVLLIFMTLIMALLDMIGVASVLPFMLVVTNQSVIETNLYLNALYNYTSNYGVENNQDFIFALGLIVFLLLVFSLSFKALTTYMQVKFVTMREYSISKRLIEGYLKQQYSWFINRHSADFGKVILSEVGTVIGNILNPLVELISRGMVAIALIVLLLITDPMLTMIITFFLVSTYLVIYLYIKNILKNLGIERLKNNELRFLAVSEAFSAIKEIKVRGLEKYFINKYSIPCFNYNRAQAHSYILTHLPRFFLEAITFGGMLLIILFLIYRSGGLNQSIPLISMYVFAGYRLLPAIQQIYSSFSKLTFSNPSLEKIYRDFQIVKNSKFHFSKKSIEFKNLIQLIDIYYHYPNSSQMILKNINLSIPVSSKVGIVGTTGSGKTTVVDVILGLLEPSKGLLKIDNTIINKKNSMSWQNLIGYVPQNIYLSDDTVAANIAFGVESDKINQEDVEKAAKIANIHDFIKKEMPNQYLTKIGERGNKISGGQRQRIGLARALYHKPKLLILDEATSSLDFQTEKLVMKELKNLDKKITIILIAHRLNTVEECDIIYQFENGKIVAKGSFAEVVDKEMYSK